MLAPKVAVELGSLSGYSAIHLAAGMADTGEQSELHLVDLWEDYPYQTCPKAVAEENLSRNGLLNNEVVSVSFHQVAAKDAAENFRDRTVELLHVDLSNNGADLQDVVSEWFRKLKPGAMICFEGGSVERDAVDWMKHYEKVPIQDFIKSKWFRDRFTHTVVSPFPSMTIATKKVRK